MFLNGILMLFIVLQYLIIRQDTLLCKSSSSLASSLIKHKLDHYYIIFAFNKFDHQNIFNHICFRI